ncbi:MAG: flagellar assembly protein FliX [Siculibacillus sp.]|nr:flagellar assembly protein FliX [Siculibacillus sp.]
MAIRIDGPGRTGGVQGNAPTRAKEPGGATFSLPGAEVPTRIAAPTIAAATPFTDLAALMALQGVPVAEDEREKRRKAARRGLDLLDVLDGVRLDLLGGGVPSERLERLVQLLGKRTPSGDERLDALVADVELRARVELAKFGRFPE